MIYLKNSFYLFLFLCCIIVFSLVISSCRQSQTTQEKSQETGNKELHPEEISSLDKNTLLYPQEKHLKNVHQLTFGGDNAEAYFSFDDRKLVFQRTKPDEGIPCDQIFVANLDDNYVNGLKYHMLSNGLGRTTCAYFLPGNQKILYASTFKSSDNCPPLPDKNKIGKYVWPIYNTYEIYIATLDGSIVKQLTNNNFYDAEATVSPKGDKIVFTSNRSGDLELYTMNIDGNDVQQITDQLGYDGGAFFSPDGSKLVFRASRPKTDEEIKEYKDLLSRGLVAPIEMELFICNADGSDLHQVTHLGRANWAPFFTPDGKRIIFSSNHQSAFGFPFNLWMVNIDGTGLEQITYDTEFDAFPMFSFDGKKLIFSSNRNNGGTRETNLFLADWVD